MLYFKSYFQLQSDDLGKILDFEGEVKCLTKIDNIDLFGLTMNYLIEFSKNIKQCDFKRIMFSFVFIILLIVAYRILLLVGNFETMSNSYRFSMSVKC